MITVDGTRPIDCPLTVTQLELVELLAGGLSAVQIAVSRGR